MNIFLCTDSMGLHRVENPSNSEGAVSLHLYCPPFQHCRAFDERTGHAIKCPVTFYSKYGEKIRHVSLYIHCKMFFVNL